MKNIWRIALLGYLFGMFVLLVCVITVVTGIVEDMGIAVLSLPILCPILLILFRHFSKSAFEDSLYGHGAFVRWSLMGVLAGLLNTVRLILEERAAQAGIWGVGLLVTFLFVFWLMFFVRRGKV